ncbi:unnamed protein product [Brassica rapa subsp. narinosa]|uniref:(rape) hypothetical protein n=1 Tax=Brassica napus TaxID=3708 RepID=A0A816X9T3_BRANA|nr:unnamed protein product [Brassica napus]
MRRRCFNDESAVSSKLHTKQHVEGVYGYGIHRQISSIQRSEGEPAISEAMNNTLETRFAVPEGTIRN